MPFLQPAQAPRRQQGAAAAHKRDASKWGKELELIASHGDHCTIYLALYEMATEKAKLPAIMMGKPGVNASAGKSVQRAHFLKLIDSQGGTVIETQLRYQELRELYDGLQVVLNHTETNYQQEWQTPNLANVFSSGSEYKKFPEEERSMLLSYDGWDEKLTLTHSRAKKGVAEFAWTLACLDSKAILLYAMERLMFYRRTMDVTGTTLFDSTFLVLTAFLFEETYAHRSKIPGFTMDEGRTERNSVMVSNKTMQVVEFLAKYRDAIEAAVEKIAKLFGVTERPPAVLVAKRLDLSLRLDALAVLSTLRKPLAPERPYVDAVTVRFLTTQDEALVRGGVFVGGIPTTF